MSVRDILEELIMRLDDAGNCLLAWPDIAKTKRDPAFAEFNLNVARAVGWAKRHLEGN